MQNTELNLRSSLEQDFQPHNATKNLYSLGRIQKIVKTFEINFLSLWF